MECFNIDNYLEKLISRCKESFGDRLVYVGLQGSYLRGEATENSGIKDDLANWNPLEAVQLKYTTKDLFGKLETLLPPVTRQDEVNYVKISLGNFYHEICHRYIHGGDEKSRNKLLPRHGKKAQYKRSLRKLPCRKNSLCASPGKMWIYSDLSGHGELSGKRSTNHQGNLEKLQLKLQLLIPCFYKFAGR